MATVRALPPILILVLTLSFTASACGDGGGALSTEPGGRGGGQAPGAPGGEAGGAGGGGGGGSGGGGNAPGAPFKMPDINLNGKPIEQVLAFARAYFRDKCRAAGRSDTCVTVVARPGPNQQYPDCIYLETDPPEGETVQPGETVTLITGGRPGEGDELCSEGPSPDGSPPVTDTDPPTDPPVAPSGEPSS
ncbi:PASTA domain-containing protein [Actinomadura rugatobispora]|uniref:PASTA domain-containing protein n=1 Tax=Actinomadura rugatobispora TaxID=1994 RepID=A0ABW0ZS78_9ACTN|nr:hypothetical protein GCM10010200_023360 [Actinomadura rugatobispora]